MCKCYFPQVGDHEVECQPHFRLYLHTTSLPHEVPPELGAYMSIIYFHETRLDVEEELLNRFMALEKSRLEDERTTLLQVGRALETCSTDTCTVKSLI